MTIDRRIDVVARAIFDEGAGLSLNDDITVRLAVAAVSALDDMEAGPAEFKMGELVTLRSGSIPLTVVEFRDGRLHVQYFYDGMFRYGSAPPELFDRLTPPDAVPNQFAPPVTADNAGWPVTVKPVWKERRGV